MTKLALITGSSRGLGKSTALHLAKKGCDIIITYHSSEKEANEVANSIREMGRKASVLKLDTSETKSFSDFTSSLNLILEKEFNRKTFDYLVNNAGTGYNAPFLETTEEAFDKLYQIHLKGVYFLTQKLAPLLQDGGKIINISSGLARFSFPGYSAYASMKGAVEVLTRYLAKELAVRKITVNTIAPGATATDFSGGVIRDNKEYNDRVSSVTALGRAGEADDIGSAISSILVDENGWITAQRIEASGGMLI